MEFQLEQIRTTSKKYKWLFAQACTCAARKHLKDAIRDMTNRLCDQAEGIGLDIGVRPSTQTHCAEAGKRTVADAGDKRSRALVSIGPLSSNEDIIRPILFLTCASSTRKKKLPPAPYLTSDLGTERTL